MHLQVGPAIKVVRQDSHSGIIILYRIPGLADIYAIQLHQGENNGLTTKAPCEYLVLNTILFLGLN